MTNELVTARSIRRIQSGTDLSFHNHGIYVLTDTQMFASLSVFCTCTITNNVLIISLNLSLLVFQAKERFALGLSLEGKSAAVFLFVYDSLGHGCPSWSFSLKASLLLPTLLSLTHQLLMALRLCPSPNEGDL